MAKEFKRYLVTSAPFMRTVRYISAIWLEFTYLRTFIRVTCGFGGAT